MIVFLGVGKEGELPLDVAPSEDITWKIGWRCKKLINISLLTSFLPTYFQADKYELYW